MKKLFALILAMSMALSCLCGGALAAEPETEASAQTAEVSAAAEAEADPAASEESAEPSEEEESEAAPADEDSSVAEDEMEAVEAASEDEDASAQAEAENAEADRSDLEAVMAPAEAPEEEDSLSAQADEIYVLMNIPYGAFYKAEFAGGSVDVISAATASKSRNKGLASGSYHEADTKGIDGVVYPVKVDKASLTGLTEVKDDTTVTMTYNNRGTQMTDTLTGQDALMEAPSYAYYRLSNAPARYKQATLTGGVWSFGPVSGQSTASTANLTISTGGHHTYYEFNGPSVLAENEVLSGVVLTTQSGKTFGLRHVTEIWRNGFQLGWDEKDGYEGLSGETIQTIKYITRDNVYAVSTNLYVPVHSSATLSVANAAVTSGTTTVTLKDFPDDFQKVYAVQGLSGAAVSNGTLSFTAPAAPGSYTLTVTDNGKKYAPVSASFVLSTDAVPAAYDSAAKSLKAADGTAAADFTAYLGKISKVTVDGKVYNASGKGAVKLINATTGAIDTAAAPFADKKPYSIVVSATGYSTDLSFTLDLSPVQPDPTPAPSPTPTPETKTEPQAQTISAENVTKAFGSKKFSLGAKAQTALSYSSSNKKVATVDRKGTVTLKGVGKAQITITAAGTDLYQAASKTITVTVKKGKQPMTVKAAKTVLKVNKAKAQTVAIKAAKAQGKVTWKSSNKKVLVKNGKVTFPKGFKGSVKITVSTKGNKNYAKGKKVVTIQVK